MDMVSKWVSPTFSITQAQHAATEHGAHRIGSGISTTAYEFRVSFVEAPSVLYDLHRPTAQENVRDYKVVEEPRVLQVVTASDKGKRITIDAAMANQEDPFAPQIYGMVEFTDGFACEMEKLEQPHSVNPMDTGYRWVDRPDLWQREPGFAVQYFRPTDHLLAISPYMAQIERGRRAEGIQGYDLHPHNVMMRGEQPVVIDPLFSMAAYTRNKPRSPMRDFLEFNRILEQILGERA